MNQSSLLKQVPDENGGVLTPSIADMAGVSKYALRLFIRRNGFIRVGRGIYWDPDRWDDELLILHIRCPKIIFSHETALTFHDLTDRIPTAPVVTAVTGYNTQHLAKDGIKVHTIKKDLFDVGRTEMKTIHGNTVTCYDMERTICDITRNRSTIDTQVYLDAIKWYFRRRDKNLIRLTTYSQLFHVDRILRPYWEVLL